MLLSLGDLLNKAFSSVKSLVWLKCGTKKSPLLKLAVDTKCYFIKGATIITVIILSWTSAVSIIFFLRWYRFSKYSEENFEFYKGLERWKRPFLDETYIELTVSIKYTCKVLVKTTDGSINLWIQNTRTERQCKFRLSQS